MRKKWLPVAFLTFVNMLGFTILIPVLPFIVKEYGMSDAVYGLLLSAYSAFQFIGSPVLGAMSDTYGRKPILMISQFGTFISWVIFGIAYFVPEVNVGFVLLPILIIALARIADGITGGNLSVANAYLSDITTEDTKSKAFGVMGAITGIAMLIGPPLGSFSSSTRIGFLGTALVAGAISLVTLVILKLYLRESLDEEHRAEHVDSRLLDKINIFKRMKKFWHNKLVSVIIIMRFGFALSMSSYVVVIILSVIDRFNLNEQELGLFMLFVGVFLIFNQAFLVERFVKKFGDLHTLVIGMFLMAVGLLLLLVNAGFILYVIFYFVLNLGLSLSLPAFKTLFAKSVNKSQQGEIMGIDDSIMAFSSAIMPVIAGFLYTQIGDYTFVFIALFVIVALVIYYFNWHKLERKFDPE